jgi:quinone-modifying oxidoreductase subunit QmoC
MIWAQWGLRDRLVADPDVWLCYQCNDCSVRCPRGARPGDVLGALRQESIRHHAIPSFLVDWVNSVKALPVMLLGAAVFLGIVVLARDPLNTALDVEPHGHLYADFFPHWLLIVVYSTLTILSFLGLVAGIVRFWKGMRAADAAEGRTTPAMGLWAAIGRTIKGILVHDRFDKCGNQAPRRLAHLGAFYGFMALFIVTVWAVIDLYVMPHLGVDALYPFGLLHPMKILANVGCLLLILGCGKALLDRAREDAPAATAFSSIFLWLLFLVAITGLVIQVLRFAVGEHVAEASSGLVTTAYALYFVHLVLVFQLLVYLPYSKLAHVFYRTVAMVYAEYSGRLKREAVSA